MRAAVLHGQRDIRIEDVEIPQLRSGEVLVKVGSVGVCGTDAAEWATGPSMFPVHQRHGVSGHLGPMIPGHEFSGVVVDVGPGVDTTWTGRAVASCGSSCCGVCRECRTGRSNLCADYYSIGLHRDGALAEYVATPVGNCLPVDDLGLTLDEAALAQPMGIAVHAISRAALDDDGPVLVQGVGGVGAFLVYALAQQGVRVIATDRLRNRLSLADELGSDQTCLVSGDGDASSIRELTDGRPISVIFEVSGSQAGLRTALELAPMGGKVVLVGIQKQPHDVHLAVVTVREMTLVGTNALVRETDFPRAVELLASRRGKWGAIAPVVLPLESLVSGALEPLSTGQQLEIKTLIDPTAGLTRAFASSS